MISLWRTYRRPRSSQPGSRARYAALFAGDSGAHRCISRISRGSQAARRASAGHRRRESLSSALFGSRRAISLAREPRERAAVAPSPVAMAARRYASRHLDRTALMKCMGASQRLILTETIVAACRDRIVGRDRGTAVRFTSRSPVSRGCSETSCAAMLPPPRPTRSGSASSRQVVILLGFALPPLLQLKRVPPARVCCAATSSRRRCVTGLWYGACDRRGARAAAVARA